MAKRCMGSYVRHKGAYPQCTRDAAFHLGWVRNPSGLPGLGERREAYACTQHLAQVVRWAHQEPGLIDSVAVRVLKDSEPSP